MTQFHPLICWDIHEARNTHIQATDMSYEQQERLDESLDTSLIDEKNSKQKFRKSRLSRKFRKSRPNSSYLIDWYSV